MPGPSPQLTAQHAHLPRGHLEVAGHVGVTLAAGHRGELRELAKRSSEGADDEHYHLNRNVLGCMCHEKRALLINDPAQDPRFRGIKIAEGIRNFLCVPLMVGAELIGVLSAYNTIGGDFNEDDQRILAIIATQSAQVLEKARLAALSSDTVETALVFGAKIAGVTVSRAGANPPWAEEL